MKRIIYLTLISFLLFVASCAKKVETVNIDYFGYWETVDGIEKKSFNIHSGISSHTVYQEEKNIIERGKAKITKDEDKLKIGLNSFIVDVQPYLTDNGYYSMTIDGDIYMKY